MDSMEANKSAAAILVAGIAFMVSGLIGEGLVHPKPLLTSAIKIDGAPEGAPVAAAGQEEALPPIGPLLANADPTAGERTAKQLCAACHTFTDGGKAGVGPNLYGVVGAAHGHMAGFSYSAGMQAKQGPWTFDQLNLWLMKPAAYVSGTRMAFAGISSARQRAEVIAYLRGLSQARVPLPQ